jgi:hypothetical protein
VKIKVGTKFTKINYTTGVHQGDDMSPVLFHFIMQAFLETLQNESQSIHFSPTSLKARMETYISVRADSLDKILKPKGHPSALGLPSM